MKNNKNTWQEVTLGEVINFFDYQRIPLSTAQRKERQGNFPYYGASGIIDYVNDYIFDGKYLLISEDGENLKTRKTPIAFLASGKFWVNNHAHIIRGKEKIADDYFLMSLLEGINILGYLTGTAQPKLSQANLKAIQFNLPPLPTQQKIAGILSAYDDLIENNTRRIEILEEMARMLYREWFVKFRFPGHEAVQFVESELGLIPEGWEVKKLKKICKHINYGYTAKAKEIQEKPEEPKLLRITDIVPSIIDWNKVPYCEIEEGKIHKYLLSEGDIVIARTGATVGYAKRLHKRHQKTIFASYLVRLKVDELIVNNEYIGIIIESDEYKQFIKANMTGSAQPQANAQIMTSLSIIIPPLNLQKMFKELVTNFLDQKEILQIKNINLRKTRDLLLPRLISGEIDVENLDINTGIQP